MQQSHPDWHAIRETVTTGQFGSPLQGGPVTLALGTKILGYEADEGHMTAGFALGNAYINDQGIVMGGILSAALDLAMAMIVMARVDEDSAVATTNLQVQFLRPCPPGETQVVSRIVKEGRRAVFCESEMFDNCGKKVATATCTNQIIGNL